MTRRWLITGCSSGLGWALARAAAAAGHRVLATARRPQTLAEIRDRYPDTVEICALDVRDPAACEAAVRVAVQRFGGLDVLVNNAGYGTLGAVEELTDSEIEAQLQTLLLGPWRLTRLALPLMRAQHSGHVLMVSSTTGRSAMAGLGAYVAGKFALEGMTETLALEIAGTGVRVTLLEAGVFATNYGASLVEAATRLPEYRPVVDFTGALIRGEIPPGFALSEPEEFAEAVLALVNDDAQPPLRFPLGAGAWDLITEAADRDRAGRAELAEKLGVSLPAR